MHTLASFCKAAARLARRRLILPSGAIAAVSLPAVIGAHARGDVILEWNAIMEETVLPTDPILQTRSAAITQLAVFEAVNSIVGDYEPYVERLPAPAGASPEAAAVAAAHRALARLHPDRAAALDARRDHSLAEIPDGPGKIAGIAVGVAAADGMIALRNGDGSDVSVPYTPGTRPGDWQPTPPAFAPALRPGWGRVQPFAVKSSSQFRPGPPPSIHGGLFARAYAEVKAMGGVDSAARPPDRAGVARFYAAVVIDLWNPAARQASGARGTTLSANARIFALLAMAIHDGLISSFEAKYHYNYWRPVTAIRAGETDGNRKTDPDPSFLPLVNTPAHPSYPSNHACVAGAARAVLEHALGEDGHAIVLSSPKVPEVVLSYTAFKQIAHDIDDARVFGGVHFRFDQHAGARQGRRVGEYIMRTVLRPMAAAHDDRRRHRSARAENVRRASPREPNVPAPTPPTRPAPAGS